MTKIWTMGEMIVEIMRVEPDLGLKKADLFKGPYPSGAPAIFIDTAARLGQTAGIIGGVGQDAFGQCLLERLQQDGVNCSKVVESKKAATGVAFVSYSSDGSRQFIFHMGNTPAVEPVAPQAKDLSGIEYFHIMGCSLMAHKDFAAEIIKTMYLAKEQGAKISFDPNIRKELLQDDSVASIVREVFKNTNILLPGVEELLMVTEQESVDEAIKTCLAMENMEVLVVKKGSKGCTVYTADQSFSAGVYEVKVLDPTGAGDSFDAGFLCGLMEKNDLRYATKLATAAASLNTNAFGPMEGKISLQTVAQMMADQPLEFF